MDGKNESMVTFSSQIIQTEVVYKNELCLTIS